MSSNRPSFTRGRSWSEALAVGLIGATLDQEAAAAAEAHGDGQEEPLRRETSAALNRERHDEHRRVIAAEMLSRTVPLMCTMWLMAMALVAATLYVYSTSLIIYITDRDKPCDQPLSGWLLSMLMVPPIRMLVLILRTILHNLGAEACAKRIAVFIVIFSACGYPALLAFGLKWLLSCQTCQTTNPGLYRVVVVLLVYHVFQWTVILCAGFGVVRLVFWLTRSGLLSEGPGVHMAAKAGCIERMQTVPYDPNLFSDVPSDDRQPPECSVCQVDFDASLPIKRTPCGHYFHEECLGTWLGRFAKSCPLCRVNLEDAVDWGEGEA